MGKCCRRRKSSSAVGVSPTLVYIKWCFNMRRNSSITVHIRVFSIFIYIIKFFCNSVFLDSLKNINLGTNYIMQTSCSIFAMKC